MANVTLRGYTQMTTQASGVDTKAWPSGTIAGDLAVVVCQDGDWRDGPADRTGWTSHRDGIWAKRVTTGDLAAALSLRGRTTFLVTFVNGSHIGRTAAQPGLKLSVAGAGLFVDGWGSRNQTTLDPSANRLGTIVQMVLDNSPNSTWFVAATAAGYTALAGTDDDREYRAFEIVPVAGPNAPVLISPAPEQQLDVALAVPLVFAHQTTSSGAQDGYRVSIRAAGAGSWQYLTAAGGLSGSLQTVSSSSGVATVSAGVLSAGSWEWQVATSEGGVFSAYSPVQSFTLVAAPTVDSVSVSAPAQDLTPAPSWTRTLGQGTQIAYQVRVTESAATDPDAPMWDSGVVMSAASSMVISDDSSLVDAIQRRWGNGSTYKAWVRIWQTGGLDSGWVAGTFTPTWTAPAAPSLVSASVAHFPLRVTVSGIPTGRGIRVEKSIDTGATWTLLRDVPAPGSSVYYVRDALAGYGVPTYYRACSYESVDGVELTSAWEQIPSAVSSTDESAYLVSDDGVTYLPVTVLSSARETLTQGVSTWHGLSADSARVDKTPPQGWRGTTVLETQTESDRATVIAFLTEQPVWWLRWGPEIYGLTRADAAPTRMRQASEVSKDRKARALSVRQVEFSWVEAK